MSYKIGDLVSKKVGIDDNFGVIVSIDKANSSSLKASQHSKAHLKNSQDIYYVFFTNTGYDGPYYTSELCLKQSNGTTTY